MMYRHLVSLHRKDHTETVDGQLTNTRADLHIRIPALVQINRSTTGSRSGRVGNRGFPEQPAVGRVYTEHDVSDVREDDILVFHKSTGDETFTVLRANDQGGRSQNWRIEIATT